MDINFRENYMRCKYPWYFLPVDSVHIYIMYDVVLVFTTLVT